MSKFISLDIETTGLDPEQDQILSIGLVIEDSNNIKPLDELPSLHLVIIRDRLEGNVFALDMNRDIVKLLKDYQVTEDKKTLEKIHNVKFSKEEDVVNYVIYFLHTNGIDISKPLTVAGKNVAGFDVPFLKKLPKWNETFTFHQRVIDPAILFVDWEKDELLPNLNTCMKRAGVEGEVTHDAVQDCKDVIKVLRTKY